LLNADGIQLLFADDLAGMTHDKGDHRLTPFRVGGAHYRHFFYGGMGQQRFFHFTRVDIGAAANDNVFGAVLEVQ